MRLFWCVEDSDVLKVKKFYKGIRTTTSLSGDESEMSKKVTLGFRVMPFGRKWLYAY